MASEKLRHDNPTAQVYILAPVTLRGMSSLSKSASTPVSYTEPGSPNKYPFSVLKTNAPGFSRKLLWIPK